MVEFCLRGLYFKVMWFGFRSWAGLVSLGDISRLVRLKQHSAVIKNGELIKQKAVIKFCNLII